MVWLTTMWKPLRTKPGVVVERVAGHARCWGYFWAHILAADTDGSDSRAFCCCHIARAPDESAVVVDVVVDAAAGVVVDDNCDAAAVEGVVDGGIDDLLAWWWLQEWRLPDPVYY